MITIKNQQEIRTMRQAGRILAAVKALLWERTTVGVSGLELDALAEQAIRGHGATPAFKGYKGFRHSICLSINEEMIHGIPSARQLQRGDLVKVDVGCVFKGMHADAAFTKGLGPISQQDQRLITVAHKALAAGVAAIARGKHVGDISAAIWAVVQRHDLFVPWHFSGHGIGYALHEEPYVYNKGVAGTGARLQDGMVLCIEPMILQQSHAVRTLADGWTVVSAHKLNTAHYEHTVLINQGRGEILTGSRRNGKRCN